MKSLQLRSLQYKRLEKGFRDWLDTLGYATATVYNLPNQLREFLHWLEQKEITDIKEVKPRHIKAHIEYFKNRKNQRRPGGLSVAHINRQIETLKKFSKYLKHTGQAELEIKAPFLKKDGPPRRTVLTIREIQALYKATDGSPIGIRDKAILTIFYGCGLRKSEGANLEMSDVLFERKLLYVRKAKNNYEKYVPVTVKGLQILEQYIYEARPLLIDENSKEPALFISERGVKMNPQSMVKRLEVMKLQTGIPELRQKTFGLHALRHSIATHLLQAGMDLENIALFLGHRTLDSTQIYTHIVNHSIGEG